MSQSYNHSLVLKWNGSCFSIYTLQTLLKSQPQYFGHFGHAPVNDVRTWEMNACFWRMVFVLVSWDLQVWARARNLAQTRSFTAREEHFDPLSNLPRELTRILLWQLICLLPSHMNLLLLECSDWARWRDCWGKHEETCHSGQMGSVLALLLIQPSPLMSLPLYALFEFTYFLKMYMCAYVLLN